MNTFSSSVYHLLPIGYGGINFHAAQSFPTSAIITYRYHDQLVTTHTRIVTFGNNSMTIQTVPTPFYKSIHHHHQNTERRLISSMVYSLNGQLQLPWSAGITKSRKSLGLPAASSLVKGRYIMQAGSNDIITTKKIIKQ